MDPEGPTIGTACADVVADMCGLEGGSIAVGGESSTLFQRWQNTLADVGLVGDIVVDRGNVVERGSSRTAARDEGHCSRDFRVERTGGRRGDLLHVPLWNCAAKFESCRS